MTIKGLDYWMPKVKALPPAAAPCGLVMDGDRLDAHREQCLACKTGTQALSAPTAYPVTASKCGMTLGAFGDPAAAVAAFEAHVRACKTCQQPAPVKAPVKAPALCQRCGSAGAHSCSFDGRKVTWCGPCDKAAMAWARAQSTPPADPFAPGAFHARPDRLPPRASVPWAFADEWDLLADA